LGVDGVDGGFLVVLWDDRLGWGDCINKIINIVTL